ncbi:TPA: cupin domain-containing protein [Klebsiella pneumoniae]|uniref:(R)-mandelonitrile lyase n=1 Tax=Klebsiella pneumoniae TaxID=573 RepID=UPI0006514179|nr:cupin domain-containing protein [Klebsiella pneumoniae]HBX3661991.1 cupin domain-containing protein [Klebsiella pneumoniae subsp. pneumoniae]EKQ7190407.1 cupin domain-containing protein [Klebsiella pneumoniae]EKQ7217692.1 cupin domain-containing protein [Klebsiella pneumoniae]EKZ6417583.1 cupin domain-containing protein [Klebsiella pneumoniae]EKZ6427289.1 cupin domain-containing protein [Klebsiella pneumoniae]
MKIFRQENLRNIPGPADRFTGEVLIKPLFDTPPPGSVAAASVTFFPGARTAWHTHAAGQHLIVLEGTGCIQINGQPVQVMHAGDIVWIAPGERHWHGAMPDRAMTHIAVQERMNGNSTDWEEPVPDETYYDCLK